MTPAAKPTIVAVRERVEEFPELIEEFPELIEEFPEQKAPGLRYYVDIERGGFA